MKQDHEGLNVHPDMMLFNPKKDEEKAREMFNLLIAKDSPELAVNFMDAFEHHKELYDEFNGVAELALSETS